MKLAVLVVLLCAKAFAQEPESISVTFDAAQMYVLAKEAYVCGQLDGAQIGMPATEKAAFMLKFQKDLERCEAVKALLGLNEWTAEGGAGRKIFSFENRKAAK